MTSTLPSAVGAGPGTNDAPGPGAAEAGGKKKAKAAKTAKTGKDGKPKKKKLPKILMLVVLLAAVGFVGKGKFVKPHYGPGHPAPAGQVLSLTDSSSGSSGSGLTTSLSDGHLVQVSIALQLSKVASTKVLTADVPKLLDVASSVLGTETYTGMLTAAGQTDAKNQMLLKFQKMTGDADGAPQVQAVYFDGLIVQ